MLTLVIQKTDGKNKRNKLTNYERSGVLRRKNSAQLILKDAPTALILIAPKAKRGNLPSSDFHVCNME
jgi:hypothetical protein